MVYCAGHTILWHRPQKLNKHGTVFLYYVRVHSVMTEMTVIVQFVTCGCSISVFTLEHSVICNINGLVLHRRMRCGILLLPEKFNQKWSMGRMFTGEGVSHSLK